MTRRDDSNLDPWAFFGVPDPGAAWGAPSPKQAACLERAGVPVPESRRQASALIGAMVGRTKAGLCTYRQAMCLLRMGECFDARVTTFGGAAEAIDDAIHRAREDEDSLGWDGLVGTLHEFQHGRGAL